MARLETDLRDINARKAAVGEAALAEAGCGDDADYQINERTGEISTP